MRNAKCAARHGTFVGWTPRATPGSDARELEHTRRSWKNCGSGGAAKRALELLLAHMRP